MDIEGALVEGSVVQLRSGGPAMTVSRIETHDPLVAGIGCVWFDTTARKRSSWFPPSVLRRVGTDPRS